MTRIARKAHSVKRQSKKKLPQKRKVNAPELRYTIRKDSLDRRFAVDKRTGRRVSLQKAQKERERRKTAKPIPQYIPVRPIREKKRGIEPVKQPVRKKKLLGRPTEDRQKKARKTTVIKQPVRKKKSLAISTAKKRLIEKAHRAKAKARARAKKGWETRRAAARARSEAAKKGWEKRRKPAVPPFRPVTARERILELTGIDPSTYGIPPSVRLVEVHTTLADRIDEYPKVKEAALDAFDRIQGEWYAKRVAIRDGTYRVPSTKKELIKENLREIIAERIRDYRDVDRVLEQLWEQLDGEYSMRGLYELYFSPGLV